MEETCHLLFVKSFFSIKSLVMDQTNFSTKSFMHLSKYNLNSAICNGRKTAKCLYSMEDVFSR